MTLRSRGLLIFAVASLLATGLGGLVMHLGGVSPGLWIRSPIAWTVALAISVLLVRRTPPFAIVAPLGLAVVALSFLGAGQEGVHRWLELGPVQLNAAGLVLPVVLASFSGDRPWLTLPCLAVTAGLLAWQPDISQLSAFAVAAVVLSAHRFRWIGAIVSAVIAAGLIALCLSRPDPLLPVEHVEGIFSMAWTQSPAIAVAMAASLAAAALSPLLFWQAESLRWKAVALAGYLAITAIAFLFGAYPVPLAGYGVSFVLGWWLGFAALAAPVSKPGILA